jgi:predicted DNA-binding transcriptional regulator AlpA
MPIQESRRSREPQLPPPNRVFRVRHWAALCGLSYAQAKSLIRSGKGPRVVQLSERRIGITERDHEAWLASRTRPIIIALYVVVLVALATPAFCQPATNDDSDYVGCLIAVGGTDVFSFDESTMTLMLEDDLAVNSHPHVEQRNWQPGDDDDPGGGATKGAITDASAVRTLRRLLALTAVPAEVLADGSSALDQSASQRERQCRSRGGCNVVTLSRAPLRSASDGPGSGL